MEAYSVAVRVSLINGAASGLLALSRQFKTTHMSAMALKKEIKSIELLMLGGGAMAATGAFGLHLMKPALEAAKQFQTQVAKFSTFGLGDAMTLQAAKFAKGMNVVGSTYVDNMRRMNEAQGVFRESGLSGPAALAGAKLAAPMLAKIDFANSSLDPETQGREHAQALQMLRFIEMRGGVRDAGTFNRIADTGFKAIRSSGGNISWEQLRQFMARGGVAAQGLSDAALFGKLEPVIGELKGGTAGTGLMTAYNRLQGLTRVPNQVAHELVKAGIWDGSKITWNSQGGIKTVNGNPLKAAGLMASDPVEFYRSVIQPMYAGKGLDQNGRNRENALIFGRTGGAMFSLIDRQMPAILRSVASQNKAMGVDAAGRAAAGTLQGQEVAFHAQVQNFKELAGEGLLPVATQMLRMLTPALTALLGAMKKHPDAVRGFMTLAAGLSGLLVTGGTIMMTAGAFRALGLAFKVLGPAMRLLPILGTGISMIGGAVASIGLVPVLAIAASVVAFGAAVYEMWKHWDPAKGVFQNIKAELGGFITWLTNLPGLSFFLHNDPKRQAAAAAAASAALQGNVGNTAAGFRTAASVNNAGGKGGNVYLDGKKVGRILSAHLAPGSAAHGGSGSFDPTMIPSVPGLAYHGGQ